MGVLWTNRLERPTFPRPRRARDDHVTDSETRDLERELGDRYQIVRALGRGAFGAVYLGRERLLHRLVAIKVLHAERAWSDEERERLLREARTIANLSHPAIIPLLAFDETPSTVFMVMPYVGGETPADDVAPRVRLIDFGAAAFPMRDAGVNARHETWEPPSSWRRSRH
jgi:predicted Ser/Thr protein kinase